MTNWLEFYVLSFCSPFVAGPRKVGLLPVGPREVFYFLPTIHRRPMKASPYPPPGDALSRGYRLPEDLMHINSCRFYCSLLYSSLLLASIDEHHEHHHPQPYKFGYQIKDHHGSQHRQEHGDGHGNVQGSYGFTDHKGIYREVHYVADHHGFRATVKTNEPGTANQNPANVQLHSNAQHGLEHYGYHHHHHQQHHGHRQGYNNQQYPILPLQHHDHEQVYHQQHHDDQQVYHQQKHYQDHPYEQNQKHQQQYHHEHQQHQPEHEYHDENRPHGGHD
ncbi:hypothetical protein CEXT_228291 [Caerostris extrusa]|uniref:Cuticle protein 16.8 n=1 Tax=Caerostris extrusa TaxID=172846 RepID=A0AAV4VUW0_CAEEX|nr:hypothetical protein CEXT_228291 [Caerostris extrusa]